MKKYVILFLLFIFLPFNNVNEVSSSESIYVRNYIVMDALTNEILESKNENETRSVASISKIMTAIIAIESDKLFDVVTIGDEINECVGSAIYLSIGEKITIIDLLYGLLLRSGNDCALSIASNISKSIDDFVLLMNDKARELNMNNTVFSNPSGLDINDNGNISTCYDMSLLMSYCLENELFCQIINTKRYKSLDRIFINKNKLLNNYEYLLGGKTGYTYKAKRTLINAAEKNSQKLIVCTFDCGQDFTFHKNKFEKYFNEYDYYILLTKGDNKILNVNINSSFNICYRLRKNEYMKGTIIYRIFKDTLYLEVLYIDEHNNSNYIGKYKINNYVYNT